MRPASAVGNSQTPADVRIYLYLYLYLAEDVRICREMSGYVRRGKLLVRIFRADIHNCHEISGDNLKCQELIEIVKTSMEARQAMA